MKHKCKRCGHEWEGRNTTPPKACARCKSYQWQVPLKKKTK
jgi:predicted Zn-ribbon and HTH transcriptional regulator